MRSLHTILDKVNPVIALTAGMFVMSREKAVIFRLMTYNWCYAPVSEYGLISRRNVAQERLYAKAPRGVR
jgi:hypothetical protein